ncbi:MAG: tetratricopeptide repeat protein [Burkholderiaceae bacterium]|nr:tetratricopeptide repeat protein [Burkholderiaceae bacterium]MDH3461525.1 tetratricopeptide repeat protein [Burkholderiaceae bacterium]
MNAVRIGAVFAWLVALTQPAFAADSCANKLATLEKPGLVDNKLAEETIACFSAAVKNNPNDADAYYGLGSAHYSLGLATNNLTEFEASRSALKTVLKLNPNHAKAKEQLVNTEGWIQMSE